jgi:hypothetical protein
MNKTLITTFAVAAVAALPAFAADNTNASDPATDTQMKTEGQMNPTAGDGGVQPNQQPGAATSNRSNEPTPAPANQVDKAPTGETSDRTPDNHQK